MKQNNTENPNYNNKLPT